MFSELFDQLLYLLRLAFVGEQSGIVSLPFARRSGEATLKWKQDIAEGANKRDLEKAKQVEKPKL